MHDLCDGRFQPTRHRLRTSLQLIKVEYSGYGAWQVRGRTDQAIPQPDKIGTKWKTVQQENICIEKVLQPYKLLL